MQHDTETPATTLAERILGALNEGDLAQALVDLQALQAEGSAPAMTLHLAGLASLRANEIGKAVCAFEAAHRLDPQRNEPVEVLAILYAKLGRLTDGLYYAKLSIAAQDRFPIVGLIPEWLGTFEQSFFNMEDRPLLAQAERAIAMGSFDEAIRCYRQAVELDANSVEIWRGLAGAYRLSGKPFESVAALRRIEAIQPAEAIDYAALGDALEQLGQWDEATQCHDRAATLAPSTAQFGWGAVRCRLSRPAAAGDIAAAAQRWTETHDHTRHLDPPTLPDLSALAARPLRLGVYTASWLDPAALTLVVPLLMALPPSGVALHVYSDGPADTPLARRLRGHAKAWEILTDLDDETAAFMLGNEELDVLVDLDGPLRRRWRPSLFTYRPHSHCLSLLDTTETAKVAGFLGILLDDATGLTQADAIGIPGLAASLPRELSSLVQSVPQRPPGGAPIVFGSLAPYGRISLTTTVLWSDILNRLPGAVLALEPERLAGEHGVTEILDRFGRLGLRDRIRLEPPDQPASDYLAHVDVLLDPPGSPHYEELVVALAAGVPVLSLRGTTPATRVVGNWLTTQGLDELIAHDGQSYVDRACAAAMPEAQMTIRARIRAAIERECKIGTAHRARLLETALRAWISAHTRP